jgi:hypothetical protein
MLLLRHKRHTPHLHIQNPALLQRIPQCKTINAESCTPNSHNEDQHVFIIVSSSIFILNLLDGTWELYGHRSTYKSQTKLSKLSRISITPKSLNDILKHFGDLMCSNQPLWSPLLSTTSKHFSMKKQMPTTHFVQLSCGFRKKCHASNNDNKL